MPTAIKRLRGNPGGRPLNDREPEPRRKRFNCPRWIQGESAVVYHLNNTGKGQLYVYQLEDDSTRRVSTNARADYRYPHGESAPC